MSHRLCPLRGILDKGILGLNSRLIAAASLHFPINVDDQIGSVKKKQKKTKATKHKNKENVLHSLRVTLICDCICCIRGWPACHTRFDCSICQLLRCIFFVSHYLTETYLIGSMKVLMGLHRKFLKTILSMKHFTVCMNCIYRLKMFCLFLPFLLFFFFVCPLAFLPTCFRFFHSIKYAKYLEGFSTDGARHVYKKACTVHLPKKPSIHLRWAAFEEQQGKHIFSIGYVSYGQFYLNILLKYLTCTHTILDKCNFGAGYD